MSCLEDVSSLLIPSSFCSDFSCWLPRWCGPPAQAGGNDPPITPCPDLVKNLATGFDDAANSVIAAGSNDDEWQVLSNPSGSPAHPAVAVNPHVLWFTPGAGTSWVSDDPGGSYMGPGGDYTYQICFCLNERFQNPRLNLDLVVDNDLMSVTLNGNPLFTGPLPGPNGWYPGPPFNVNTNDPTFFHPGKNCVEIVVRNLDYGPGGGPTGLLVSGGVTADHGTCCCPKLSKDVSTGYTDLTNSVTLPGTNDDDWVVLSDPGANPAHPAVAVKRHPWWFIPGAGTSWVSHDPGGSYMGPGGDYTYQMCFCLDQYFQNPTLNLDLVVDNDLMSVTLNSNPLFTGPLAGPNGWYPGPPFNVNTNNPAFFHPGKNCVELVVRNLDYGPGGGADRPAGLGHDDCRLRLVLPCGAPPLRGMPIASAQHRPG